MAVGGPVREKGMNSINGSQLAGEEAFVDMYPLPSDDAAFLPPRAFFLRRPARDFFLCVNVQRATSPAIALLVPARPNESPSLPRSPTLTPLLPFVYS